MFCTPGHVFSMVPSASGHDFMFCAPRLVFGGTEVVRSRFFVYRGRPDWFRQSRGRRVPIATGLVSMFCASGLISGGAEGVGSHFHILRSRTRFLRYRGRQVPFSCFARLDSFSAISRVSGPVFLFRAPRLVFGGAECVWSRFHVLRARTHFRRYRGRPILFSCFPLRDMFLAGQRALDPIFMFCAPGHVFGGADGVGSRFHVLRSRTRFRRYRGRRVPFSCYSRSDSF
jgi:hypothetical protein